MEELEIRDNSNNNQWTTIIKPHYGWLSVNIKDIWRYRDLIFLFVRRDFIASYKQTILGPFWFLIQPLFTTIAFTVVFGRIANIPTDGLPGFLFYMAGTVTWNYFANCLTKTSDTFMANAGLFGKVYFPRLTVPISVVITNLFTYGIQLFMFLGFLLYFYLAGSAVRPNLWILITPFLILEMAFLGLGVGILISSMTTKYRDLSYAVSFGVSLWMYATPIVYPVSQIPERWLWIYVMNPMASIVETFRYAFLGAGQLNVYNLMISFAITMALLCVGIILFSRIEKTFMDTV
jgi:lipopolysaccharide transport system permease protein